MKAGKKRILLVLSLTIISCIFIGWYHSYNGNRSLLNQASQMNVYESGNKLEITANTGLYNKIIQLIDMDFPDIYGFDSPVSPEEFKIIKNFSVELVFNNPEPIKANTGEGRKELKISSIIFPLDEQWEYQAYVTTEDGLHYFVGTRDRLQTLVKHIVPTTN